jgi:parvulin-like peptidyl-prolyl isomerase
MQSLVQNDNLLAGMAYEQISKEVKIGEPELKAYYETHKGEYDEVHARHILIRMQGSPVPVKPGQKELTEAEALAKVQDLRKKIQGGADFGTLAIAESDDTDSGAKGGDMPPFKHGQMVPAFEEAAFAMKAGELSEPVKSQFGYHLIKVESKSGKSFEDAKPEMEKHMRPEAAQKAMEELQKSGSVTMDPEFFGIAKQ